MISRYANYKIVVIEYLPNSKQATALVCFPKQSQFSIRDVLERVSRLFRTRTLLNPAETSDDDENTQRNER